MEETRSSEMLVPTKQQVVEFQKTAIFPVMASWTQNFTLLNLL